MSTNKQTQWITVKSFGSPLEANLAKGLLESEGIVAFVRDEFSIGIRPHFSQVLGGARLDVPLEDYERARSILDIPAASTELVCPKCGGHAALEKNTGNIIASVLLLMIAMVPIFSARPKRRCEKCGYRW